MKKTSWVVWVWCAALLFGNLAFVPYRAQAKGLLIKNATVSSVYYVYNGKRYSFPNEKIYFSWYVDFSDVQTVSDQELATYPLAGNVTYKPGVVLVKVTTDPKVYAVSRYGVLRWVTSEAMAKKLYGSAWNTKVHDLSDAFFIDYAVDAPIATAGDYIVFAETSLTDISQNIRPVSFIAGGPSSQGNPQPTTPVVVTPPTPPVAVPAPPVPPPSPSPQPSGTPSQPVTDHPRIWLTAADVQRLRTWAVDSNPLYKDGLKPLAVKAKADMDSGVVDTDKGDARSYEQHPRELYAMLFAFMSMIENDQATRDDYAARARQQLMAVMNEAVKGVADNKPYRDSRFSTNDRAHFYGEAFGTTVDWIYAYLTDADKATIQKVFVRWADEIRHSTVTGEYAHPTPIGVVNDAALFHLDDSNQFALRFSVNNHFTFHERNMLLNALAISDEANLKNAVGAWLYMTDHVFRTQLKGGFSPEGLEYMYSGIGAVAHSLLALKTAGRADPAVLGQQVSLSGNPFWKDAVQAFLQSLPLNPVVVKGNEWMGTVFQPAAYGDADKYRIEGSIKIFGALGLYDMYTNNTSELNAIRWLELNVPPGGAAKLPSRMAGSMSASTPRDAIFAFMLFDPKASPPTDPRPAYPTTFFGEGLNRLLARTNWTANASWFTYKLSWNRIDHQHGDGNMFEFYRKGEWLTKKWVGYGATSACSDYNNTLTVENDPTAIQGGYQAVQSKHGSQYAYIAAGDPTLLAKSFQDGFVYLSGDATNLYNSTMDHLTDVTHVSRSIVWLKPDHIVVYDRATTKTANRFKRFWLDLPTNPTIQGKQAVMTTEQGQRLIVSSVLPQNAVLSATSQRPNDQGWDETADGELMKYRLKVEAPGGPQNVRFLNVLQGADAGGTADAVSLIQSSAGTSYEGAIVHGNAVLFPVQAAASVATIEYTVPAGLTKNYVTGLTPNGAYTVTSVPVNGDVHVTITAGGNTQADAGGVLVF